MIDRIFTALDARRPDAINGLLEFLRIPSISTQPDHKPHMERCAQWLAETLGGCGFEAQVTPTAGHPVVLARNKHVPGRPTVLYYGHYDVQPPEPLDLWKTPPFEPTVRTTDTGHQAIFARGASDDKGQVWAHIEALRVWHQNGGIPLNVILLIEGEEEVGSGNLGPFIQKYKDQLQADVAMISDNVQYSREIPAVTYGLRGMTYLEVFLTGIDYDLHSGQFGGSVPNAGQVLAELVASLHDADGRINLPGFYDDVVPLTQEERDAWAKLPFDEKAHLAQLKLPYFSGEKGYTTLERRWIRPTCEVNGLTSGYQGVGAKTVIPAKASAKISMRLVPNQDPRKIAAIFKQTLRSRCPQNMQMSFDEYFMADPIVYPLGGEPMKAAGRAIELGYGKPPAFVRGGGTLPVVGLFKTILGLDTLLVGFGLPDNRTHSPNEKFDLDSFRWASRTAAALYDELSRLKKKN